MGVKVQDKALQGRSFGCIIKVRTVNIEIKTRIDMIMPTLLYASEAITWNEGQKF